MYILGLSTCVFVINLLNICIMKARNKPAKGIAKVLYKVDPKKLSIKICYTSSSTIARAESTTTFENFSYERVKIKPEVPEQIGQLPAYVDGMFFFETEEEALEFIRRQIGM